jgi:hypothetical protein
MRHAHIQLTAAVAALGSFAFPAHGAVPAPPANVHINVDFNVFTEAVNHWQATGAFEDQGTIKHDHSEEFKGAAAAVTDSPVGTKGTFTWTFQRSFTADPKAPGLLRSSGGWRMLSGTGDYAGISGQGTVTGTFNSITGQLHDEFVGKVTLP